MYAHWFIGWPVQVDDHNLTRPTDSIETDVQQFARFLSQLQHGRGVIDHP